MSSLSLGPPPQKTFFWIRAWVYIVSSIKMRTNCFAKAELVFGMVREIEIAVDKMDKLVV